MIRCSSCGMETYDGVSFCPNCGTSLAPVIQPPPAPSAQQLQPAFTKPPAKSGGVLAVAIVLIIIAVVIVIALILMLPKGGPAPRQPGQQACIENWSCSDWAPCSSGQQSRVCVDSNSCGTELLKPATTKPCAGSLQGQNGTPSSNGGVQEPDCIAPGFRCSPDKDCCGHCLHDYCRNTPTYCGDNYCDTGENCSSCPGDCDACPVEGVLPHLEDNVFHEPLSYLEEQGFEEDGYVVVKYIYSTDCSFCYYPVDIESQLTSLAGLLDDLFVLVIIETSEYPQEAAKYAVGGTIFKPTVRVEGISGGTHGYDMLYGGAISNKLMDGDIQADVAPLICNHSDYCDFKDNKVVKTAP